jgi:lycopene cyclase domain-containing protein
MTGLLSMNTYLLINLIIIAIPLVLTFVPQLGFYKKLLPLFISVFIVGGFFILWDVLVTARGDWMFNYYFTGPIRVLGLPAEEILFFITVPYACIFLYEGLIRYMKETQVFYSRGVYFLLAAIAFLLSFINLSRDYTAIVLLLTGLLFVGAAFFLRQLFISKIFWVWMICCMLLFFIFNYFLTALPVVIYNPEAILNIRITTIPIEDFSYNFCMLTMYLALYLQAKKILVSKN